VARILVAEDEAAVSAFVSRALTTRGHEVTSVPDGLAALEALERASYDLLLTDIVMPDVFGGTLAEEAIRVRPDMKVLFMSVHSRDTFTAYGALRHDSDLLEKPFTPIDLVARVRESLDRATPPA